MKTKSKPIRKRGVLTMDGLKKTFGKAAQAVSEKVGSNAGIWFYSKIKKFVLIVHFWSTSKKTERKWILNLKRWNDWPIVRQRQSANCWVTQGSIYNLIQERDFKKSKIGARCSFYQVLYCWVIYPIWVGVRNDTRRGHHPFRFFIKKHPITDCLFMIFHHNDVSVKLKIMLWG